MNHAHDEPSVPRLPPPRSRRRAMLGGLFVANIVLIVFGLPLIGGLVEAVWDPLELVLRAGQSVWRCLVEGNPSIFEAASDWIRSTLSLWHDVCGEPEAGYAVAVAIVMLAAAPVALVAPLVGPAKFVVGGRSMRSSVVGAALIASGLTWCVLWTLVELAYLVSTSLSGTSERNVFYDVPGLQWMRSPFVWCVLWLAVGAMWAFMFRAAGRTRDPGVPLRLFRLLLAGTALELALGVSTLAWSRKRDNCLCGWASFWAIIYGLTVLMLLCGPAVVLLITRRARLQWARFACSNCGYPRRTDSDVCSECGCALR